MPLSLKPVSKHHLKQKRVHVVCGEANSVIHTCGLPVCIALLGDVVARMIGVFVLQTKTPNTPCGPANRTRDWLMRLAVLGLFWSHSR